MSTEAPAADVEELDRLCNSKKLSRSHYIREALDNYNKNPLKPVYTRGNDIYKGEPMKRLALLLDPGHIDMIKKHQTMFKATKIQIIRQAMIQEAIRDGETFKAKIAPLINPKWEEKWVKATDIYGLLGMHRNNLYRTIKAAGIDEHEGSKTSQHYEKWYRLTDIIRIYRLNDDQVEKLMPTPPT
ncbi:MAG TPA: hypothetical protein VFC84_07295 [Desulfosporosinus sp.]|nr:hypothetical protein [Desulfosporosinus sp.]